MISYKVTSARAAGGLCSGRADAWKMVLLKTADLLQFQFVLQLQFQMIGLGMPTQETEENNQQGDITVNRNQNQNPLRL